MNIKDSYIHGDLAVVRSIESLSVSNDGNLVLTYKKADSGSTEETKNIAISSFNSALSNKFVTLDTAQTVSGKKTFSNGIVVLNGLLFDKGGTATADEVFHIDGSSYFKGAFNVTGIVEFSEGIRLHHVGGLSSLWFGAVNSTGYDAGMSGITVDSSGMRFRLPTSTSGTSVRDVLKIGYDGNTTSIGDFILANTSGGLTPSIVFLRGLLLGSDTAQDWRITSNSGYLYFDNNYNNGSYSSFINKVKMYYDGSVTASKFIKSGATASNILLADGSDIAQSTLTNAFTGTVSVENTSDSPSKLQVTVGSKSGSTVVGYAKQAHDLYRILLTNGLDLNSLTDEGVYVTTSSAVIQSLVNNPSGVTSGEYRLEVVQLNSESTGSYVILNLTRTSGNAITNYQRSRNSSGTWSSWHIQYDDVTLTKSVITNLIGTTTYAPYNANGYLPLDGGTLTGNLTIKKSSGDIGTYVEKTDSNGTTIRQLLFGIGGASGVAGIYDYATNSWIVSIAKNSPYAATFNGNSTTSTLTKYTLTSSAYHLVGVNESLTSTATARSAIGRNDVLVTASGAIQAVDTAGFNLGTSATIKYNTTNQSIDFIFN